MWTGVKREGEGGGVLEGEVKVEKGEGGGRGRWEDGEKWTKGGDQW